MMLDDSCDEMESDGRCLSPQNLGVQYVFLNQWCILSNQREFHYSCDETYV